MVEAYKTVTRSYQSLDRLTFGKYKGLTIDFVAQIDPAYIKWMYDNELCDYATVIRWRNGEFSRDLHARLRIDEKDEAFYADNIEELTSWIFKVPDRWVADFENLKSGQTHLVSHAFRAELRRVFPKFAEQFAEHFNKADEARLETTIPDPI